MKIIPVVAIVFFLNSMLLCADEWSETRKGIKNYMQNDFEEAKENFEKAKKGAPDNPITHFNIGSTLYRQNQIGDALKFFLQAIATDTTKPDTSLIADALYNVGNCAFVSDSLQQAMRLYRSSLILDQFDEDAKYNLELITRMMSSQEKSKRSEKEKEEKEEKQDQPSQEQNAQTQQKESKQKQQNKQGQMTKEEAERLMDAMEMQEEKLLKDWLNYEKEPQRQRRVNPRDW